MFSEKNLIINDNSFREFIDSCLDEKIISIDTEFVRNKTFYPELCLIQIGTSQETYAIDPKKNFKFGAFKKNFKKKKYIKSFSFTKTRYRNFF